MNKEEFKEFVIKSIPITKSMGIEFKTLSTERVIIKAPLSLNKNHLNTAFGGSLNAIATLGCWSFLQYNLETVLERSRFHIVISKSQINYLSPIDFDFEIESHAEKKELEKFHEDLLTHKQAKIEIIANIYHQDKKCLYYRGTFVATCL